MVSPLSFFADCLVRDRYAIDHSLEICNKPEDCGYLQFADGTYQETVGRVHTYWTFKSGERIPITFEVLENCCSDLIIGDDILWDHNVFEVYASSIIANASSIIANASSIIARPEECEPYSLAPFGWLNGWQKKVFGKGQATGKLLQFNSLTFILICFRQTCAYTGSP